MFRKSDIVRIMAIAGSAAFLAGSVSWTRVEASTGMERIRAIEVEPIPETFPIICIESEGPEIIPDADVILSEAPGETPEEPANQKSFDWSAEDTNVLLKIAMAEAEGEDTEGKALVMLTVINRAWSDQSWLPDSIQEVVFQKVGGSYQFSTVRKGGRYWTTTPNEDCYRALELVENGWDGSEGALYFESISNKAKWHKNNLEFLFQHGRHRFYK